MYLAFSDIRARYDTLFHNEPNFEGLIGAIDQGHHGLFYYSPYNIKIICCKAGLDVTLT